jgi:hypothetical protein
MRYQNTGRKPNNDSNEITRLVGALRDRQWGLLVSSPSPLFFFFPLLCCWNRRNEIQRKGLSSTWTNIGDCQRSMNALLKSEPFKQSHSHKPWMWPRKESIWYLRWIPKAELGYVAWHVVIIWWHDDFGSMNFKEWWPIAYAPWLGFTWDPRRRRDACLTVRNGKLSLDAC